MSSVKHICLFCSTSFIGGAERMALAFLKDCDPQRFKPHLVTLLGKGPVIDEAQQHGIPTLALDWQGFYDGGAKREFKKFLIDNRIELIHNFGLRAELLCRPLARKCGIKKVVSGIRDTGVWRKWYHVWTDRLTAHKVNLYIANSKNAMDHFQRREKIPREKSRVIYNGLKLPETIASREAALEKFNIPAGRSPVLIELANLVPGVKGHDILFAAIKRLRDEHPGLLLICAGQDKSGGAIQKLSDEMGIRENVHFTGYVENVFELLPAADIAVLPSRYESFPVSLLEALAVNLPADRQPRRWHPRINRARKKRPADRKRRRGWTDARDQAPDRKPGITRTTGSSGARDSRTKFYAGKNEPADHGCIYATAGKLIHRLHSTALPQPNVNDE